MLREISSESMVSHFRLVFNHCLHSPSTLPVILNLGVVFDEESVDVSLPHGRVDFLLLQQRPTPLDRGLYAGLGRVRPLVPHEPRDEIDLPKDSGHFRFGHVCTPLETLQEKG